MSGVQLEKVVKAYGAIQVVDGIDLYVQEKERVVLVGPSGCRKSTTLRMIAELEAGWDGMPIIDGRTTDEPSPRLSSPEYSM